MRSHSIRRLMPALSVLSLALLSLPAWAGDTCVPADGSNSSTATGIDAFACGENNAANGNFSFAFGRNNTTDAFNSSAFGYGNLTNASGATISMQTGATTYIAYSGGSSAFGSGNQATAHYATAMGYRNQALGLASAAFGFVSLANQRGALAIGTWLDLNGNGNIEAQQFGNETANATGLSSVAIGAGVLASADYSTAVGVGATATGLYGSAFGYISSATGDASLASGYNNKAIGRASAAVGLGNIASASESNAFGYGNRANGENSSTFGHNNEASAQNSNAVGMLNKAANFASSAVGYNNTASGAYSNSFGFNNQALGEGNSVFGVDNVAAGEDNIALGHSNNTGFGNQSIAIGHSNTNTNSYTLSVGSHNNSISGVAMGFSNFADEGAIAIGTSSSAGPSSVAFGRSAEALGSESIALGINTVATGQQSTALGYGAVADRNFTISVGSAGNERQIVNVADGTQSTDAINLRQLNAAIGSVVAGSTNPYFVADGANDGSDNAVVTGNNAVAIGANSVADEDDTVAVGDRRITDVEDAEDDQDAVNLRQLVANTDLLGAGFANWMGGGATYVDGAFTAPTFTILGTAYHNVGDAFAAVDNSLAGLMESGGNSGPQGPAGASAYQVAVNNGFAGTETDWLTSLQGPTGPTGPQGPVGGEGIGGGLTEAEVQTITDAGDITTLETANEYTDATATETLASANEYTDARVTEIMNFTDSFDTYRNEVDQRFQHMDRRLDKLAAMSGAYAGMAMNTAGLPGKDRLGVGVGAQGGEQALAVGYQRLVGKRASVSIAGAFGGGEKSVSAGAGFSW